MRQPANVSVYSSLRKKAWRNVMVAAINEGLRMGLFGLAPNDNQWHGNGASREVLFDFLLPNHFPARCRIADIGHGELSVNVLVSPGDGRIPCMGATFRDGEAIASGWLERKLGAWLQTTPELFRCRRHLVLALAGMTVAPAGYSDSGDALY